MLTLSDHPVLTLNLSLPRGGNWVLDSQIDHNAALSGEARLLDAEGNEFVGTVWGSAHHVGRAYSRIVGGKGGLGKLVLDAKHYQAGVTARIVAEDAISAAGETLDPSSDPLSTVLPAWSRAQGTAQEALSVLAAEIGITWRVLPNGNVWLGQDSSDAVSRPEVLVLDRDDVRGFIDLGLDALSLRAGDLFNGERITRIQYAQTDTQPLRARAWFERGT